MKRKFDLIFRSYVVALAALLLWSVWSCAQTNAPVSTTNTSRSDAAAADTSKSGKKAEDESKGEHVRLSFGLDKIEMLNSTTAFGQPLWKYLAALIYIFLAFYVSKFLDFLTRVWLKKFTARTRTRLDDLLLGLLNGPIKIVAFVIFLNIGLEMFDWPDVVKKIRTRA